MYEDKTLICKECGKEFVFTAGEQNLRIQGFRERAAEMQGMPPEPQECSKAGTCEMYTAVSAACGKEGQTVPSSRVRTVWSIAVSAFARMKEER